MGLCNVCNDRICDLQIWGIPTIIVVIIPGRGQRSSKQQQKKNHRTGAHIKYQPNDGTGAESGPKHTPHGIKKRNK